MSTAVQTADEVRVNTLIDELLAEFPPTKTDPVTFLGAQYDKGLAWVHFAEGQGGLGLNPKLQRTINERLFAAGAPNPVGRNPSGHGMCGPTVAVWGSDAQKQHAAQVRERVLQVLGVGEELPAGVAATPGA